ncbi:RNA polymerase-binding transcription factor [Pseudobythopirellula maris]|uniref:RNA polymerase-binding transcription factor n=1 Tax=Pseudobythopirellula maris TaxID=2527991 RepID=A0A5C5ZLB8_9BACT|nr:TraR/DksA C4-type zinc finger protein [Pseudobythopirellula maris]TWT87601.1 RNA polymerase-binding transcription factor [Pseudobythopirellula maris]
MKKADMLAYKERLLALRARLRGDVNALASHALRQSDDDGGDSSSMPIHMAELGSENFEQEFSLSLMETEETTLTAIDTAIERVDQGTFGKCVECEGVVPKTRLNAIPFTPVCVRCAEKLEGI